MKLNYQQRIILALQNTEQQFDPEVITLNIQHDDDCPVLKGGKKCNCVPDIHFTVGNKKHVIDEEGVLQS